MELTKKQAEGLKIAVARYKDREPYTCIAGYAGAGKSTLIKFIVAALNINPDRVAYLTPTGKAAQVLRSKGNTDAKTIHKALYGYKVSSHGAIYKYPKPQYEIKNEYDLIIVDEISMVTVEMWNLLLSYGIYVIACGDPFQLPAIGKSTDALDHPHIFLDEIMRQAQESEIIRVTMDIREGKTIKPFRGKEINIVPRKDFILGMLDWADQTICATNKTRNSLNNIIREKKFGYIPEIPQENEKCVCLKNNWDICTTDGDALVNGLTGYVTNVYTVADPFHDYGGKKIFANFAPDDDSNGVFKNLLMDYKLFTTGEPTVNAENRKKYYKNKIRPYPNELTYAYAVTAWKSQGSEWSKVLVLEENFPWDIIERKRFLYTALTRASEKCTLVLKD